MLATKAVYDNGKVTFSDKTLPKGKMTVIVTFLEDDAPVEDHVAKRRAFAKKWAGAFASPDLDTEALREQRIDDLIEKHA